MLSAYSTTTSRVQRMVTSPIHLGLLLGSCMFFRTFPPYHIMFIDYLMKRATYDTESGQGDKWPSVQIVWTLLPTLHCLSHLLQLRNIYASSSVSKNWVHDRGYCNPQPSLKVYGQQISHVSDFKYLGSMMALGIIDVIRRKSLAWAAFWKLGKIWRSSSISLATKNGYLTPLVWPWSYIDVNPGYCLSTWKTR